MQCEDYHKHYLILRNCREAPSVSKCASAIIANTYRALLHTLVKSKHLLGPKEGSEPDCVGMTSSTQQSLKCEATTSAPPLALNVNTVVAKDGTESTKSVLESTNKAASVAENNIGLISPCILQDCKEKENNSWLFLQRVFQKHFCLSMTSLTQYCGPGFNKDKVLEDAIAQTPIGAVWDTSHPFAASLCKPWIWLLTVILFSSITYNLIIGIQVMAKNGLYTGKSLRFTALDSVHGSGVGISSLGFLRDGCSYSSRSISKSERVSNRTLTVSYADEIAMNGWWISIPLASIERIPHRFYVEVSGGGAIENWEKIGSSSYLWAWSGSVIFFDGRFDLSRPPKQTKRYIRDQHLVVEFDMRLPWIWCCAKYLTSIFLILMTVSAFIASHTKNQMRGRVVCALIWFALHIVEMLVCIGYLYSGEDALAILSGIYSASDFIYAIMLTHYEHIFRQLNGLCGALFVGAVVTHYLYLDSPHLVIGEHFGFENRGAFEGIGLIMLSLSGYIFRFQSRRRAEQVMAEFHQAYDKCWEEILESERVSKSETIKQITECTDSITTGLSWTARQRGSDILEDQLKREGQAIAQSSSTKLGKCKSSVFCILSDSFPNLGGSNIGQVDPAGPLIVDLDQLFAQAEGVDHLLQRKVQQWALLSNGCFPVASAGGNVMFERWEKIVVSEELLANVKWGRVKSRKRAIEKLYRSYNCDVSRLLDCCRQSIYFEHLNDLLACMKAIASDPESKIVRAKNRLRPDCDASSTAGFRNVALNLQVLTNETRRLRIETHICEVQLVTVDFAKLKVRV